MGLHGELAERAIALPSPIPIGALNLTHMPIYDHGAMAADLRALK